ncbi:MAG: hemerythrin domain-containing protein [Vampirovibrio sp.]|nr:hemerythrin domain-containing protein [Vampirovibrio sp.]
MKDLALKTDLEACEPLLKHHEQLEALLLRLDGLLGTCDAPEEYVSVLAEITPCLNMHLACEEEGLFPVISKYHSMVLMEVEHEELTKGTQQLQQLLGELKEAPAKLPAFKALCKQFISDHLDHIGRENNGIFPMVERELSLTEKETVLEKVREVEQRAAQEPIGPIQRKAKTFQPFALNLDDVSEKPVQAFRLSAVDAFDVKHMVVKAGHSLAEHWSPNAIFMLCMKGKGRWFSRPDKDAELVGHLDLAPGVGVAMDPQLLHGVEAQEDCHLVLVLK